MKVKFATALLLVIIGCAPAVKKPVLLNVIKVNSLVEQANDLSLSDPNAALNVYRKAIENGKEELLSNPGAVNTQVMKDVIDRARLGRARSLMMLAGKAADNLSRQRCLSEAQKSINGVQNKNIPEYRITLEELEKMKEIRKPPAPEPAPEPTPSVPERKPEPKKPAVVKKPKPPAPPSAAKPKTTQSKNQRRAATDNNIRLKPGDNIEKRGKLEIGESARYRVITGKGATSTLGDLEVLVLEGYTLREDQGLEFKGIKQLVNYHNTLFMRYIRLKVLPGTEMDVVITRGKKGPEEFLAAFYLYPR